MSVPSSKTTVTCERPNLEMERELCRRDRPLRACSTGKVTFCSTSSGPRPGTTVLTCTCTGVVSGKASTSSWLTATPPTAASTTAARITAKRCRSEKSMTRFSTRIPSHGRGPSLAFAELVLQQHALEHRAALGGDDLARQQTGEDLRAPLVAGAE